MQNHNNEDEGMSKYAVDEGNPALEKFANPQGQAACPTCGAIASRHGRTLVCPVHGSEPFEQG